MRLLIVAAHPSKPTGYGRHVSALVSAMDADDVDVTIFGIQNYAPDTRPPPPRARVHDVVAHDEADHGYGTQSLAAFVDAHRPDVVLVYNSAYVCAKYLQILAGTAAAPKIVVYLDQIYATQPAADIAVINAHACLVLCYTGTWATNAIASGVTVPVGTVGFGLDHVVVRDAPPAETFMFLNLNRNQERKRLDLTVQGYARFVAAHPSADTLLVMGNAADGHYDLASIYANECRLNGVADPDFSRIRINVEQMSDDRVTDHYAACDVGVNTCQGEGFGLCNYEHAMFGKPQIVSNVGGLRDHFTPDNSACLAPVVRLYGANVCEMGEIVSPVDVGDAMTRYYEDRDLYARHARQRPTGYTWRREADRLVKYLREL